MPSSRRLRSRHDRRRARFNCALLIYRPPRRAAHAPPIFIACPSLDSPHHARASACRHESAESSPLRTFSFSTLLLEARASAGVAQARKTQDCPLTLITVVCRPRSASPFRLLDSPSFCSAADASTKTTHRVCVRHDGVPPGHPPSRSPMPRPLSDGIRTRTGLGGFTCTDWRMRSMAFVTRAVPRRSFKWKSRRAAGARVRAAHGRVDVRSCG